MAIKDIKEPGKSKSGKSKSSGKTTTDSNPWKVGDNGQRTRATRALPLETKLREIFVGMSGMAMLAGDEFTANAIELKSEELAYGYAKLAQSDPRVKRAIEFLLEGSAWSEAIIPTVSLVVVVGWHYGMVPDRLGVPMTMANGMIPMSREQELELRARQQAQAAQEMGSNGAGDGSTD